MNRRDRKKVPPTEAMLDETSAESFPASDPPGFASLTGSETGAPEIVHDVPARRFLCRYQEGIAYLQYELDARHAMVIPYTETPPPLRGRGIASSITRRTLEYARDRGLRVVPQCPFVAWYIERHPEFEALVERR